MTIRCKLFSLLAVAALMAPTVSHAAFGRADFVVDDNETFSESALVRGTTADAAKCAAVVSKAVWVTVDGESECLRYWTANIEPKTTSKRVLVFFSGDQLTGRKLTNKSYLLQNPAHMQSLVDTVGKRYGIPYIFLGRLGMYGSSGEHSQRRRPLETKLISAALDEIKKRHGIEELVVAGQSGGGHVVASLLTYRSDIVCAVPTSAASMPTMRWLSKGMTKDTTGYADSYEPSEKLDKAKMNPNLRVFVVGDTLDSNVPFATQMAFAEKLRGLGVALEVIQGTAADESHHGLAGTAVLVGARCALNQPTEKIITPPARGFRG